MISTARLASASVTRPIRKTTLRSVTTLKLLVEMSLASTKAAFTLPVRMVSFERAESALLGIAARSLTIERTFSTWRTAFSTAALSASVGTSPVSSTSRL